MIADKPRSGVRSLRASIDPNATVGAGNLVNQVTRVYNDFGQLVVEYQSHAGAVNVSTSPKVQYAYADGSANTVRPERIVYPDGRELYLDYGAGDGIDDQISRVATLMDDDGTTHLADYSYLGLGSPVIADYTQPDLKFTLADLSNSDDPDTGDIYSGLDRFGRTKDVRWYDYGGSADAARIKYGYDRASNRLYRDDPVAQLYSAGYDELYRYDSIYRLKDLSRGTLNGGHKGITSPTFGQCWTLDKTGNWSGFRQDNTGDGTWDLIQNRVSNPVNEITGIYTPTGPAWAVPAYDAAGNMTTVPQPRDPEESFTARYDAWNRLVKLTDDDSSQTVQENAYDGRGYRIRREDKIANTMEERHYYYTSSWQVLEERVGSTPDSADPDRQFVWGLRYIDDLILRDRDTDDNGSLDQRLYGMQDGNWNMVALAGADGTVQERYTYSAYGQPLYLTPSFGNRVGSAYGWETLYAGYRYDIQRGMYPVRNRFFNPAVGVWITRDPIGYALIEKQTGTFRVDSISATMSYSRKSSGRSDWSLGITRSLNGERATVFETFYENGFVAGQTSSLTRKRSSLYLYSASDPLKQTDPTGLQPPGSGGFWDSMSNSLSSMNDTWAGVISEYWYGNSDTADAFYKRAYKRGLLGQSADGPAWSYYGARVMLGVATLATAAAGGAMIAEGVTGCSMQIGVGPAPGGWGHFAWRTAGGNWFHAWGMPEWMTIMRYPQAVALGYGGYFNSISGIPILNAEAAKFGGYATSCVSGVGQAWWNAGGIVPAAGIVLSSLGIGGKTLDLLISDRQIEHASPPPATQRPVFRPPGYF